jgi:glycosyltransferase involved in cell wall biosynthesis
VDQDIRPAPKFLSLSSEFPNPSEPGKGLFIRSRLRAIAAQTQVTVVAPVALLDYANPHNRLLAGFGIPRRRADDGIEVLHPRWLYPPFGGWINAFFLFARLLAPAVRLRRRDAYNLIDAHFAHPEGIAAALLGLVLNVPFMVTIRGSELRYRDQAWKRFWIGWALRRADRVIAVADNLRSLAIELGVDPARARTIPNGVDTDIFFRRDKAACRRTHNLAPAARVILCAGDLAELKGHHKVIRALTAMTDDGLSAQLVIAGGVGRSGRYVEMLRAQVAEGHLADRVRFAGEVDQHALAELMSAADVFCLASRTEGWPNVVNEALACGTPVVATDVGAVRQMIRSEELGTVVPVTDEAALTSALRSALSRDWDHHAISTWGQSRSWKQVADEVLDEARKVVEDRCRD